MNENPEGTPNPLNPAPGTGEEMAAGTGLDFVETEQVSEVMAEPEAPQAPEVPEVPEVPQTPEAPEAPEAPETLTAEPAQPASFAEPATQMTMDDFAFKSEPAEPVEPAEPAKPAMRTNYSTVDPMMRPVSRSNFDTLGTDNAAAEDTPVEEIKEETFAMATTSAPAAPVNNAPDLVAKDSIVEPAGKGGKKKALIIGAIVFLMIAIICGAAAIAMMVVGNKGGDRVNKAIEKLINGDVPNVVSVQGRIDALSNVDDSDISSFNIDFNGGFDRRTSVNNISAKINAELSDGNKVSIGVDELQDEDGNTFFKVRGLDTLMTGSETNTVKVTDCVNGVEGTDNCMAPEPVETVGAGELLALYGGVFEIIDDQWILTSGEFTESMEGLGIFDNSSACLVNAISTLPKYAKDITKKYDANQFITYTTDKLAIAKKKNDLYKLNIDSDKLAAFVNSLSNNGFVNELNACAGNTATNTNVTAEMIESIFAYFPEIYVEIDEDYNFTRLYFRVTTGDETNSMTTTADLSLSYPAKLDVTAPEEYIDMSTLVTNLMTNLFSGVSE